MTITKTLIIISIFALVGVSLGPSIASSLEPPEHKVNAPPINKNLEIAKKYQKYSEPVQQASSPQTPALSNIISAVAQEERKGNTNQSNKEINNGWWNRWRGKFLYDPIAWFTLALVIFTATLAYLTNRQFRWNKKVFISSRRAFVFVDKVIDTDPSSTENVRTEVIWKNSGETPAKGLLINYDWHPNIPDSFQFFEPIGREPLHAFMGPKATISIIIDIQERWPTGLYRSGFYIYGWAEYDDIFPNTQRHRTEFCFEIVSTPLGRKYIHCKKHNAIDDECYHKVSERILAK